MLVLEDVDPGRLRQPVREVALAPLRAADPGGVGPELLQGVDPDRAEPPDDPVEDVDRGAGVVERPVVGRHLRAEVPGEGRQLVVAHLVPADDLPGQPHGVEDLGAGPAQVVRGAGRLEEADVEAGVVGDEDGTLRELEELGHRGPGAGGVADHRVGDARQGLDERRDRLAGVDEGLQLAEHLATADLDRTDLGDAAVPGGAPGRLEIDHDEGDLGQRGAEITQPVLHDLHVHRP